MTDIFEKMMAEAADRFNAFMGEVNRGYPCNVIVNETETQIQFALAGIKPEEIEIKVVGSKLMVQVDPAKDDTTNYKHHGISKRSMHVPITLYQIADRDNISSTFENGLLTITLPVKKEEVKTIKIN